MVVVVLQSGNMNQAINKNLIQRDEQTKPGHTAHYTCELFTNMIHHIFTLQPIGCIPCSIIGPSFCDRTLFSMTPHRLLVILIICS